VRVDALEEAPSAMLRSRDERDRPRRGDRDDRDRDRPRRERGEGFVPAPEGDRT